MQYNTRQFNQQRRIENKISGVVQSRIVCILSYIVDCYYVMVSNKPKYSIAEVLKNSTYKFEEYLTSEFVENYLNPRISNISLSQLNRVTFSTESTKKYIDVQDMKEKPDKIDIFITNLGLENELSSVITQPYFALECKRIRKESCINEYLKDIKKFTNRKHCNNRLPFEGQIAYMENPELIASEIVGSINEKLLRNEIINTIQKLELKKIHETFEGCYYSKHLKDFGENNLFSIYHLMFDFSKIVVD